MLDETERHEALTSANWDEARVKAAIERIAGDAEPDFTAQGLWPVHPIDRSPERPPDSIKPLYHGAAG